MSKLTDECPLCKGALQFVQKVIEYHDFTVNDGEMDLTWPDEGFQDEDHYNYLQCHDCEARFDLKGNGPVDWTIKLGIATSDGDDSGIWQGHEFSVPAINETIAIEKAVAMLMDMVHHEEIPGYLGYFVLCTTKERKSKWLTKTSSSS